MGSETRMVKLHRVFGKPLYVNAAQICAVYETDSGTSVHMANEDKFLVKESPEQILGEEL